MSQATCPGEIVTDTSGAALCQDMGGAPLAWTVSPAFSIDALDPLMLSGAFAAGFILVGTGWAIGYGAKTVLKMLK
ncbi:MAG TPA: hypothetical protein PKE27_15040 [Povalibacter sp.]|uniref:hypothetical protein n=1 Tax=Povalibacter sp. TaxID=1962978 RepID=UPI002C58C897|nr:hypothetical protein [Povalibacter sp.]HMN45892.1 hypothetical protein [Povalibacter sp.]